MFAVAFFSENKSRIAGTVHFSQEYRDSAVTVTFRITGLVPNSVHACHIHKYGDLRDCGNCCEHYNPHGAKHGSRLLHGKNRHAGDLSNNLMTDAAGFCNFSYEDDLISLYGEHSIVGRSVVIHSGYDDHGVYRDEPSERGKLSGETGNAGSRLACAVIGLCSTEPGAF